MTSTRRLPEPKYLKTRYIGENGCTLCSNLPNQDGYIRTRCVIEQRSIMLHVNRVGYIMVRKSDQQVYEMYERIKYGGEYINQLCREFDIKRSTLSSIMNKRSRCGITDLVDALTQIFTK